MTLERRCLDDWLAEMPGPALAALLRDAHFGVAVMRDDGTLLAVNSPFAQIVGRDAADLVGHPWAQCAIAEERHGVRQWLRQFRRGERLHLNMDQRVTDAAGATRWVRLTVRRAHGDLLLVVAHAVGDAVVAQDALRRSEERLRLAIDATGAGWWDWDLRADIVDYSEPFERLLHYTGDDFHRDFRFRDRLHAQDRERCLRAVDAALQEGVEFDEIYRLCCFDGRYRWFRGRGRTYRGADGRPERFVGLLFDWQAHHEQEARLRRSERRMAHLARHDPLTQLPNRLHWDERLQAAIALARRQHGRLAVLMLDLDRFKWVNDGLGHEVGDALLRDMALRLRQRLRQSDVLARWGGDEFTILLDPIDTPDDAARVARALLEIAGQPWEAPDGQSLTVGASIGIALYPEHGHDAESLLRSADAALYAVKAQGRGGFRFNTEELNQQAHRGLLIESRLRRAVQTGAFHLVYQPQWCMASGRLTGAEALLRWTDPVLGGIPPDTFIPIAEACGLMPALGDWVLAQACATLRQWRAAEWHDAEMAVNVSPRQLADEAFFRRLTGHLERHAIPPAALELEVTESTLMDSGPQPERIVGAVKALGMRVVVDDFGVGHSSLALLKRLAMDGLKIDRSFVRDLVDDEDDRQICAAILAMAKHLRLRVVAEGVETEAHWRLLRDMGCDRWQGYWRDGQPQPADAVLARALAH